MTAGIIVADHAAGHAELLGTDDLIILGDNAGAGRYIHARSHTTELIENQRVQHVDALGDNDGVLITLHLRIAVNCTRLKIVNGHLHQFPVHQLADGGDKAVNIDAQG